MDKYGIMKLDKKHDHFKGRKKKKKSFPVQCLHLLLS